VSDSTYAPFPDVHRYAGLSAEGRLNSYNLDTPSRHHYLQGKGAPTDSSVMSDRFQKEWEEVGISARVISIGSLSAAGTHDEPRTDILSWRTVHCGRNTY